jgi:putative transposase
MERRGRIQLHPRPEQHASLLETLRQFTTAFNLVCETGWQQKERNGVRLHHLTFYAAKAACPDLPSNLLIQARVKATEAIRSAFILKARGKKPGNRTSLFAQFAITGTPTRWIGPSNK